MRNWDKKRELKPAHVSQVGTRYYSEEQRNQFLGIASRKKTYMIARGYQFDIIQDIGSGINYNKKGLNQLLDRITNGEIEIIDNKELMEDDASQESKTTPD